MHIFPRNTKIVSTLGPASNNEEQITALLKAGVNCFRLNFSHGDYSQHAESVRLIRRVSHELGITVAIMQDLQGPKIRLGKLPTGGVDLKKNSLISLHHGAEYRDNSLPVPTKSIFEELAPGQILHFGDGEWSVKITSIVGDHLQARVLQGGTISSNKGIIAEGHTFSVSALTKKDYADIDYVVEAGLDDEIDFVAFSFVKSAKDVHTLRHYLKKKYPANHLPRIIAKLETQLCIDNLTEIVQATDVVMVARGDLALELPAVKLPYYQRLIVKECCKQNKPVIVATQMLESMVKSPVPTRAEINDVSTAVLQGADATMTSGETAMGANPSLVVETMSKILFAAEDYNPLPPPCNYCVQNDESLKAIISLLESVKINSVVLFTDDFILPNLISQYTKAPVFVFTENLQFARQLALTKSVHPQILKFDDSAEDLMLEAKTYLLDKKYIKKGEQVLCCFDLNKSDKKDLTDFFQIRTVA